VKCCLKREENSGAVQVWCWQTANNIPFSRSSADLILCSFLASYLSDLTTFARQIRRLLRRGGSIFLSDLHPVTVARLGWRRGFTVNGTSIDIATHPKPIPEVVGSFAGLGIEVEAMLEPLFGNPERELFNLAGKTDTFKAASGVTSDFTFCNSV